MLLSRTGVSSAARCGVHTVYGGMNFWGNPRGKASYTVLCADGWRSVSGTTEGLMADGYCIETYGNVGSSSFSTVNVCPKGQTKRFGREANNNNVAVYTRTVMV